MRQSNWHSDGAISVKVWRNHNKDGRAVYSTTFQRTYTDAKTGEPRESHSLYKDDLLKLSELAIEARRSISRFQEQDRERTQEVDQPDRQDGSIAHQRNDAMANAAPDQKQETDQHQGRQDPQRQPGMEP